MKFYVFFSVEEFRVFYFSKDFSMQDRGNLKVQLTRQHVYVSSIRDGENVGRHFATPLTTVQLGTTAGIHGVSLVRIDGHAEQARVGLQSAIRRWIDRSRKKWRVFQRSVQRSNSIVRCFPRDEKTRFRGLRGGFFREILEKREIHDFCSNFFSEFWKTREKRRRTKKNSWNLLLIIIFSIQSRFWDFENSSPIFLPRGKYVQANSHEKSKTEPRKLDFWFFGFFLIIRIDNQYLTIFFSNLYFQCQKCPDIV